jgi:hypothetical protein
MTQVLTSFSATSLLTLIAITAGYFVDAIRDEDSDGLLNDLDAYTIPRCKRLLRLKCSWSREFKHNRCYALERFVLYLSDQQIVTGLAIFIIAYHRYCDMSSYHFIIVVAMGWFSTTTHLSTLTVLQNYFKGLPALKFIRLVGMIVTFGMLFVGMLVLYAKFPFGAPVRCRFSRLSLSGNRPLNLFCAVLLLTFLTLTFLSKSLRFCFRKDGRSLTLRGLVFRCRRRYKTSIISRKDHYAERLRKVSHLKVSPRFRYVLGCFEVFNFVYIEFLDSFLWQIVWLFFGNLYGVRQLVWARKYVRDHVRIEGDENQLNFGQLLALFLLVLPLLAAVEAYYGR